MSVRDLHPRRCHKCAAFALAWFPVLRVVLLPPAWAPGLTIGAFQVFGRHVGKGVSPYAPLLAFISMLAWASPERTQVTLVVAAVAVASAFLPGHFVAADSQWSQVSVVLQFVGVAAMVRDPTAQPHPTRAVLVPPLNRCQSSPLSVIPRDICGFESVLPCMTTHHP